MSQRTPSQRSAIEPTTSAAAARTAGCDASSWSTSGHAGKYGSRPRAMTASPTARKLVGSAARSSALPRTNQLRVLGRPPVVGRDVVRHEVEDQRDAPIGQRRPSDGESGIAAEVLVDDVVADAVRRPDDVGVGAVGQRLALGRRHVRVLAGDRRTGRAALPHAHQPHGVDAGAGDVVPHLVGHVGQRHRHGRAPSARSASHTHVLISCTSGFGGSFTDGLPAPRGPSPTGAIASPVTRR